MAYSSIVKPSDYFNTKLYTGNGGTQSITGVGFQPDMVWTKQRDAVRNHVLFDAVRGATNGVKPNESQAEFTWTNSVTSFDTDGFSVGGAGEVNYSSGSMASWNWKANGQGSANTDGSINTTYTSANTTSGFSISKYTGTGSTGTIGHGLGAEPEVIIVKKLNSTESWFSYHKPLGNTGRLVLNTTDAVANDAGYWNSTTPTSSVFSVTSNGSNNASGDTYIAYCFAPKTGYSKFGSYTGDGNTNGPFIYTGFKPAFVLIKSSSDTGNWHLADNKRIGFNPWNYRIQPSDSNAEYQGSAIYSDFLSNGFNLRNSDTDSNGSGRTYIYMAIAEEPLVANSGTDGVPATAR